MSLYDPYRTNPSLYSIHLLHMKRPNTAAVQEGVILRFSWKLKQLQNFKKNIDLQYSNILQYYSIHLLHM